LQRLVTIDRATAKIRCRKKEKRERYKRQQQNRMAAPASMAARRP